MKIRMILITAALVTFTLLAGGTGASAQTLSTATSTALAAPTSLVVQVQPGVNIGAIASQLGFTVTKSLSSTSAGSTYVISGNGNLAALQQALASSSSVAWVEPNQSFRVSPLDGGETVLPLDGGETVLPLDGGETVLPLGPGYPTVTASTIQAALKSVLQTLDGGETVLPLDGGETVLPLSGIQQAYAKVAGLAIGSPALILQPAFGKIGYFGAILKTTGKGMMVVDLDTGADTCHPALAGIYTHNFVSYEPTDPENCPNASTVPGNGFGHGTAVASLLRVLAPESNLWVLRVFDSTGTADVATVYQATVWAVDHGANIINMSFGATTNSQALQSAIAYAAAHGVLVTAAAGNSNQNAVMYPAAIQPAIAVASTDINDAKSSFSNYGFATDVTAPGSQLVAAYPGSRWAIVWGTSFASPMAAGDGALIGSAWASQFLSALPLNSMISAVRYGVDSIALQNPQYVGLLGTGRIDMFKALAMVSPTLAFAPTGSTTTTTSSTPTSTSTSTSSGTTSTSTSSSTTPTSSTSGTISITTTTTAPSTN
ncbi:MAG TPA: S8 family serine peptidase [Terriglobia bacterium]|nr:S8 family serine peptidase [Terriglobia bacterium]